MSLHDQTCLETSCQNHLKRRAVIQSDTKGQAMTHSSCPVLFDLNTGSRRFQTVLTDAMTQGILIVFVISDLEPSSEDRQL